MRALLRSSVAVVAAVGVVALAGPATAAGPYTVKVGTRTSGPVPFTAATTGSSPQVKFVTSGGLSLGCDSGTASGRVVAGTDADGVGIASITASSFTNCRGPLGLQLNVNQTRAWSLNATGAAGAVTPGSISRIAATVSDNGGQCSFTVTGTVQGSFNSTTQVLAISPARRTLRIANVQGCFGQIANGDTASFGANYAVSNRVGRITIS